MLPRTGRATLLRSRNQHGMPIVIRLGARRGLPVLPLLLGVVLAFIASRTLTAQETAAPSDAVPAAGGNDSSAPPPLSLGQQQQQIQRDYERFEQKLLELGELMRASDPDRAELLTRTRSQSRELRILDQIRSIARLLTEGNELGDAVDRQDELLAHLETLLKLLQSEDARDRLQKLIEAYQGDLKDLNKIIGEQKDSRAATERGGESGSLQSGQQRVTEHAQQLAEKIDRRDAERAAEEDAESKPPGDDEQSPSPDKPGAEQKPQESPDGKQQSPDGQPSEPQESSDTQKSEPSPGKSPPGSQSKSPSPSQSPSQSPPQPGSQQQQQQPGAQPPPQPGQQSPQQPPGDQQTSDAQPEQTPGREDLEQALRAMNQAIEELKKQNRDGASDDQDAALASLEQMKAKLEEILRQLREEEKEMILTLLEARFQEMLRVQLQINAETERLDKVAPENRESRHAAKSTDLAREQRDNALEADRALVLLKEEGSSVAFPEAVEQMRDSMLTVAGRLDRTDTGETTQLIEQIIVETLDEMILALQRELEKLKEQQQQQQQQQPPQDQDQSLVDALAELKMIRSLQNQVNRLTRQIGLDVEGEQAVADENRQLLRDLSRRQQRIQEATYDLSTGKSALGQELRKNSR